MNMPRPCRNHELSLAFCWVITYLVNFKTMAFRAYKTLGHCQPCVDMFIWMLGIALSLYMWHQ